MKATKTTKTIKTFKDNRNTSKQVTPMYGILQQDELNKLISSRFIPTEVKRRRWFVDFSKDSLGVQIILRSLSYKYRDLAKRRTYVHEINPFYYYRSDSLFLRHKDPTQGTFVLVDAVKQSVTTLSLKNYDILQIKFVDLATEGSVPRWSVMTNINLLQQTSFYLFAPGWNERQFVKKPARAGLIKTKGRQVKMRLAWNRKSDKRRSQIVRHMKTIDSFEGTPKFRSVKEAFKLRKSLAKYINWKYSTLAKDSMLHVKAKKQGTLVPLQSKLFNNILAVLVRVGFAKNITFATNLVKMGLVSVNSALVYNPYLLVKPGDSIEVMEKDATILTRSFIAKNSGFGTQTVSEKHFFTFRHEATKRDLLTPLNSYAVQRDITSTLFNDNIVRFLSKK